MKINHNDSAVITNVRLLRNENSLTASMERLSSGFRLNHAVDSPSGMAISNKMNAQIKGLNQASRNSSDGKSVLDTADGALGEVSAILQRIRELAVQAANDTNAPEDRDACQLEINQLVTEIDRIADTSEFNTKSLLNGSLDAHVYGDHTSRRYMSESVMPGTYGLSVNKAATQTTMGVGVTGLSDPVTKAQSGHMTINGASFYITEGMTRAEVDEVIRENAERGGVDYDAATGTLTSKEYGKFSSINITATAELAAALGIEETVEGNRNSGNYKQGEDAEITLENNSAFKDHPGATIKQDDNKVTITDVNGFEMSFKLESGYAGSLEMEVTEVGPMDIQVGANANQQITVRIPSINTENMYIDDLNVRTFDTASKAISKSDDAISYLNRVRANIGAYSNRLDATIKNTDNTEENMTSAISRIMDVDMAEEMTEYTKNNVLVQAATSALSQANEIPQMALQLLS